MLDMSIIVPHGPYLLFPNQASVSDLVGAKNPGVSIRANLIHLAPESASDCAVLVISDLAYQSAFVLCAMLSATGVSPPGVCFEGDPLGSFVPGSPDVLPSSPVTSLAPATQDPMTSAHEISPGPSLLSAVFDAMTSGNSSSPIPLMVKPVYKTIL
jgi:hypothetical protein